MTDPNWNEVGRIVVSVIILGAAFYVLAVNATDERTALAVSLIGVVAGFWLHVLPSSGSGQ